MVNNITDQIDNLFEELISLLLIESKADHYNSQFLRYVQEKRDFIKQHSNETEIKEAVRGINRYADEFSFNDVSAKKIKSLIESMYDSVNRA